MISSPPNVKYFPGINAVRAREGKKIREGRRDEKWWQRGGMGGEGAVLRHPPSAVVDHKAAAENGIKSDKRI